MLGLGVSLTRAAIDGARFDPRTLFADGVAGGLYDPSDLASMAATSDGTVAATIDAPVGLIRDQSPRGNHLMQTAAAARPVLRRDSDGRHYLEFDGESAFLAAAAADFAFVQAFALATAARFTGGAPFTALAGTYAAGSGWDIGLQAGVPRVSARGTATLDTGFAGFPDLTGADARLFVEVSREAITRSVDGARLTTTGDWIPVTADTPFTLGQRGNDGSSRFKGRIYGMVVLGRAVTAAERGLIEAWLGERRG